MRIRKSRLQLQSSDPQPEATAQPFQAANQSMPIGNIVRTWLFPKTTTQHKMNQQQDLTNIDEELKVEEKSFTNDTRSILINITDEDVSLKKQLQPSSSSSAQGGCSGVVGNEVHDLKKRKGILDENPIAEKTSPETKSNTNDVADNVRHEVIVINESTSGGAKKIKRGKVIMEGSRCSRVNGRGWRCCQPTLVGYSLCEHHLGKGRLRSMASTARRSNINIDEGGAMPFKGGEPKVVTKKRTKMMKARSLNSLLGQI